VRCGTFNAVLCDCVCIGIGFCVLCVFLSAMLCLWKEQKESALSHGYSAVLCDSLYSGIFLGVCCSQQC